jgi:membrane protease YdiL (CAAX protease family)
VNVVDVVSMRGILQLMKKYLVLSFLSFVLSIAFIVLAATAGDVKGFLNDYTLPLLALSALSSLASMLLAGLSGKRESASGLTVGVLITANVLCLLVVSLISSILLNPHGGEPFFKKA